MNPPHLQESARRQEKPILAPLGKRISEERLAQEDPIGDRSSTLRRSSSAGTLLGQVELTPRIQDGIALPSGVSVARKLEVERLRPTLPRSGKFGEQSKSDSSPTSSATDHAFDEGQADGTVTDQP